MVLYFDGASHSPSPKVKTYQMKDDGEHLTQFFRLLNNKVEQQQRCITDPTGVREEFKERSPKESSPDLKADEKSFLDVIEEMMKAQTKSVASHLLC